MTRALIYTRVSLDRTGDGAAVERQLEACQKLCELRGWTVVGEESDNSISAFSGKERPAWKRVLEALERGTIDVVVAWHLDRMTRSMLDLEALILLAEGKGVGIATATGDIDLTTDVGRMVARILAAVARAEVERKAARQKLANDQRAAQGKANTAGRRTFGYTREHELIEEEAEQIRDAAARVLTGGTVSSITRLWLEAGNTSEGDEPRKWSRQGVKELLLNPRLAGIRIHRGADMGQGEWEPVLDMETHLALKRVLDGPARSVLGHTGGREAGTLLSGILQCEVCDTDMTGSTRANGVGVYRCRNNRHSTGARAEADAVVLGLVAARLAAPDALGFIAGPERTEEVAEVQAELADIASRRAALTSLFAQGDIGKDDLDGAAQTLSARREKAQERLAEIGGVIGTGLEHIGTPKVAAELELKPLAQQRSVLEAVGRYTVVPGEFPRGGRGKGFKARERIKAEFASSWVN
ncbi:recombinase family protein [Rhodococcus antarcticus]|uniref:Recombinase family protein n=1 Tax=Rhodococcus antarcticus TaxID=2987751 RepID=A0ABY6NXH0_9NOCA|nr:recombinase family protein [Rhodococcus antarcticus]UZJ23683.1 recombinase family protein [Rhodococcus antarcticus]